jgi:hypothetical protein
MQNRREDLDQRRRDLAERRQEQDARRKALDERKHLYQQEVQLEEEERLLQEHERLDHLELGLEYDENEAAGAEETEAPDSSAIHAVLVAIGAVVILFAALSWFSALGNIFGIAGFACLVVAIWKAFKDEDRSVENLKIFLGGIAFFWGGAILIALCGAISDMRFPGFLSFLNFLSVLGNGILIISGIAVCIFGLSSAFKQRSHKEVH